MPCRASAARRLAAANSLPIVLVVLLLMVALVPLVEAAPPPQSAAAGEALFQQKCAACHTIGGGDLVGPDLKGVTQEREQDWLVRWITGPDKMLAEKDPTAVELLARYKNVPMPNLGITEADALTLIAYIQQAGGGEQAAVPAVTTSQSLGDAARGKALFMGTVAFEQGAPACIACHSVSGAGELGGGDLGPDLTRVFDRFGADGLAPVLAAPPFPTMRPIFADLPLSPQEQADLIAFLKSTSQAAPTDLTGKLVLIALLLFVIFMVLAQVIWRGRRTGVRRQLVEQAQA